MRTIKAAAVAATVALSAVATLGLTGMAWAGADDGGTKAFWLNQNPGESAAAPVGSVTQSAPALRNDGYSATVNGKVYDTYRHRNRYRIQ